MTTDERAGMPAPTRCAECEFVYDLDAPIEAAASIVEGATRIAALLRRGTVDRRTRRRPDVWSPLEYGCHVRDVLLVQRERVLLALRVDHPTFELMGRDDRVEHDGYAEQDPLDVARQLEDAALMFANVVRRLHPRDLDRAVVYSFPDPSERPLGWGSSPTPITRSSTIFGM